MHIIRSISRNRIKMLKKLKNNVTPDSIMQAISEIKLHLILDPMEYRLFFSKGVLLALVSRCILCGQSPCHLV